MRNRLSGMTAWRSASIAPALHALGIWAPIGFILIYAVATVLFFSGAILALAGGAPFGPVWGTAWNLGGATLGAIAAFLLARNIAGEWVARRVGGLRARSDRYLPSRLRSDLGRLHAAGRDRLYLAWLCGPIGRRRVPQPRAMGCPVLECLP